MLADLIREFCNEPENNYEVYENYTITETTMSGEQKIATIGIVVKQGGSLAEAMADLTSFLEAKGFEDPLMELDGTNFDELGPDSIMYFPAIQDYHPLQA